MRRLLPILAVLLLFGCAAGSADPSVPTTTATIPETTIPTEVTVETTQETKPETIADQFAEILDTMTTEELVGQLFLARYPGHVPATFDAQTYHLGGYILFSSDFENEAPEYLASLLNTIQQQSKIPLLMATDEEGGTVTRISSHSQYRSSSFPSPRSMYEEGGLPLILETESEKCQLLGSLGINVNMAPVCDITTSKDAFMYSRSLGQDPETTAQYIEAVVQTMDEHKIGSVLKHFPGYGDNEDTHVGTAVDRRTLGALKECDLVPFAAGIDAGCDAILVSHTVIGCLDALHPATLSPAVIGYLRNTMGFEGVIITDDLQMQAITDHYSIPSAAVLAILAGNDMLCSTDYQIQYNAVLQAVNQGLIPMERIRESVARILQWKYDLSLLSYEQVDSP